MASLLCYCVSDTLQTQPAGTLQHGPFVYHDFTAGEFGCCF